MSLSLSLSWIAAPASAKPPRGIVLEPALVSGTAEADVGEQLTPELRAALEEAGLEVVALPSVDEASGAPSQPCGDAACTVALAARHDASHVVDLQVIAADRDYELVLRARDGESGEATASVVGRCEICSLPDLQATVREKGVELAAALTYEPAPPHLRVVSSPPGARVVLDDATVGQAPLELEVEEGSHQLELHLDGYKSTRRVVEVRGELSTADFILVATPPPPRSLLEPAGAAAIAVGAAAAIVGAVFVGLDSTPYRARCDGADVDADGDCRFRYNTLAGGVTSLAVGGALLAAGVGMFVVGRRRNAARRGRAGVDVGAGQVALTWTGRF